MPVASLSFFRESRSRAFSLIELLIVIAIVALLIGILLPALRKARLEGMKAVSLANVHSLAQAGNMYQSEQKGFLPIVPRRVPVDPVINAWCTWGGWGKYTSTWWSPGALFDTPPSERCLNPYLYDQPLPSAMDLASRKAFQMPGLKDPSDKIGHQQAWDSYLSTFGVADPNPDGSSCYDDVGTSYLVQMKWFFQSATVVGGNWTRAFTLGTRRFRSADEYMPSRMIWVNDEYCDITINQVSSTARIKNGYGDINRACVGFIDGHARYMKMIPGGESDPNRTLRPWLVPAFSNAEYTVVFPDLAP